MKIGSDDLILMTGQRTHILGGGDTALTLLMGGTIGVGTPHNIRGDTAHYTYLLDDENNWGGDNAQH